MKVTATAIPEVLVLEPRVFGDHRGYFFESYNRRAFAEAGISGEPLQFLFVCGVYCPAISHHQKAGFRKALRHGASRAHEVISSLEPVDAA